jgi:hypothetical protein
MEFRIGEIKTKYEFLSYIVRELEPFNRMRVVEMSDLVRDDFAQAIVRVLTTWASLDIDNKRFKFSPSFIVSACMHPMVVNLDHITTERAICQMTIERYESFFKDPVVIAAQEAKYKAGLARAEVRKKFGDDYDTLVEWGLI